MVKQRVFLFAGVWVGVYREFVRKTGLGAGGACALGVEGAVGGAVVQWFGQSDAVAAGEGDVVGAQVSRGTTATWPTDEDNAPLEATTPLEIPIPN